jgi:acyl carrier protein
MTKEEITRDVNEFLVEEFEIEEDLITPEATWKQIGIDSLDLVDIVVIIEKKYGFKLKGEDMANIATLDQFYDHILDKVHSKN